MTVARMFHLFNTPDAHKEARIRAFQEAHALAFAPKERHAHSCTYTDDTPDIVHEHERKNCRTFAYRRLFVKTTWQITI